MSIRLSVDEKPNVAPAGSGGERSEAREVFRIAPLARTQSERRRRLALASGFRLLRSFGIDRIARRGARRGAGRQAQMG